jgi:Acyl-CoA synthetase (NDP forming)
VDGALVILPPPPMFKAEDVAEKVIPVIQESAKPVLMVVMGSTLMEKALEVCARSNIPVFRFPERAASALGALARRAEYLNHEPESIFPIVHPSKRTFRDSFEELLARFNIPIAPIRLAHDLYEAESIADELGYPVVMKIASPDILHKSDAGGVILDIQNPELLRSAYTQATRNAMESNPLARIDGIHLQRQIPHGQDVIVGAVRDPQFGPLMMFGSGGVEVEGLKDVSFALAPLTQSEALTMIGKTWAGRKLSGFRNIPAVDLESAIDVLVKLSHLILENPMIEEIEINPLRVLGKSAVALDIRGKLRAMTGKS